MPLKYNAAAQPQTVTNAPSASTGTGASTREQLFSPDGSPKPIRNLASLRERLAGAGGVNPPESQVPTDALEPKTQETPDGGAVPLTVTTSSGVTISIDPLETAGPEPAKRTRRTKAEMAEARAEQPAGATAVPIAAASAGRFDGIPTDELLAEVLRRVKACS